MPPSIELFKWKKGSLFNFYSFNCFNLGDRERESERELQHVDLLPRYLKQPSLGQVRARNSSVWKDPTAGTVIDSFLAFASAEAEVSSGSGRWTQTLWVFLKLVNLPRWSRIVLELDRCQVWIFWLAYWFLPFFSLYWKFLVIH